MNESVICVFFRFVFKMKMMHIQSANVISVIFSVYTKYQNVFSEVEMKHLSAHEKHDHIIDINDKNSSYKSLYNLSDKELQVL